MDRRRESDICISIWLKLEKEKVGFSPSRCAAAVETCSRWVEALVVRFPQLSFDQMKLKHVLCLTFQSLPGPETSSVFTNRVYIVALSQPGVGSGLGWSSFPSIMTSVVNDLRWPGGTEP